jgi:hypothetical protein
MEAVEFSETYLSRVACHKIPNHINTTSRKIPPVSNKRAGFIYPGDGSSGFHRPQDPKPHKYSL